MQSNHTAACALSEVLHEELNEEPKERVKFKREFDLSPSEIFGKEFVREWIQGDPPMINLIVLQVFGCS